MNDFSTFLRLITFCYYILIHIFWNLLQTLWEDNTIYVWQNWSCIELCSINDVRLRANSVNNFFGYWTKMLWLIIAIISFSLSYILSSSNVMIILLYLLFKYLLWKHANWFRNMNEHLIFYEWKAFWIVIVCRAHKNWDIGLKLLKENTNGILIDKQNN